MLEVRDLSVSVKGREILRGVSLDLYEGEVLLVAGRSGSGKTTLLRAIAGVAQELYGMEVRGEVKILSEKLQSSRQIAKYVAYIPQEPWFTLSTPYTVYELTFYTSKPLDEVLEVLKELGVEDKLYEATTNLSAGEIQRIALAEAVLSRKRLVLIDEITSYLDPVSRMRSIDVVAKLAREGFAIVVVDHDVGRWRRVVSKVLYLEKGRAEVYSDPLETPIYRELEDLMRSRIATELRQGRRVIVARDLWYRYPDAEDYVLRGINLDVGEGEVLWIQGSSGCGKSTLLKVLAGILKPSRGYVERPRGVQLVPENPLLYLSAPTPREELGNNLEIAQSLGLEDCLDTPILMLSSGERRRLAIASAYLRQPKALLIDEPTVGLDPWNARRVLTLIARLASRGCSVVVASHGEELGLVASSITRLG